MESLLPAHERAFLELKKLREKKFLEVAKIKEYYSELSDILRRYLDRRFGFQTLELTTFEILNLLKEKNFERNVLEKAKLLFENSDLVKFAKYSPFGSLAAQLEVELIQVVETTKPVEEVKKEKARNP